MYQIDSTKIENNDIGLASFFVTPPQDKIKEADTIEVWGTSFTDAGEDRCEYRLTKNDEVIWKQEVKGY